MQLAAALLTDSSSSDFQRAIASLPKNANHCLIFDNTSEQHSQGFWAKLCQKTTYVLHHRGEIESFAQARNALLELAEQQGIDWVLFVDSDEICSFDTSDCQQTLDLAIAQGNAAIQLRRSDIFHDRVLSYGEAGRQPIIRIFRVGSGSYHGATHERVLLKGSILSSSLELHHHSHESISAFIATVSMYARRIGREKRSKFLVLFLQLSILPIGKWFWNVVYLQAWRDGWRGIAYATIMSLHSLLVRIYQYEKSITSR